MDLSLTLLGVKFENPLGPASGPLSGSYENLKFFNGNKCGVIVTKTISVEGAQVPKPCMAGTDKLIYNCELWSEFHSDHWINDILPRTYKEKNKPMIVSVGYTSEDFNYLIPKVDPFVDFYEVSTHYSKDSLSNIVKSIRDHTDKPIFMKLSPHVEDYLGFVKTVLAAGGTGVVAINSVGPGTAIDLKNRRILLGNDQEEVWISGPAIKPIALNRVYNIRKNYPDIPIIAAGGVENAEDVLEFILAGADLVQMLSTALIKGKASYDRIVEDLPQAMAKYNFESIEAIREIRKTTLHGRGDAAEKKTDSHPIFSDKCVLCNRCVRVCPEGALEQVDSKIVVNKNLCVSCGLCESRCPTEAISGVLYGR